MTKPPDAYVGNQGNGLYVVGEMDNALLVEDCTIPMRGVRGAEIARVTRMYVRELTKHFMRSHKDYFREGAPRLAQFCEGVADKVTEARFYSFRVVETWTDADGANGPEGTLYMLVMLPLDNSFFDAYEEEIKNIIFHQQAELLVVPLDAVLKALEEDIAKIRQNPLGVFGGRMVLPSSGCASSAK